MAVNSNVVGVMFTSDNFSFGTASTSSDQKTLTYTETQTGFQSGGDATITSVTTTNGVTTVTAQFAGSTDPTMNAAFTGTVPANNEASFVLTGNFPGQAATTILFTNISSQQPGLFGTAMLATEQQGLTYAPQQMVCFASGTLIRTVRGDVAVEALAVGDLVVTASGERRPIRWLGHRVVNCRRHPRPQEAMPVRITANAFGPGKPARDLVVSPGHAICVDVLGETLIPASSLVNGSTIAQFEVDTVTYWHVELDGHDILLAEGLAAESYFEMGNRDFFADAKIVALDASPDARHGADRTHAHFCRPFFEKGALVEAVASRLAERARAIGWTLDRDPLAGVRLVADGRTVEPVVDGLVAEFALPAGATDVWLVSGAGVPALVGENADVRHLGLNLGGLTIESGVSSPRRIALDDPRLCIGFHAPEDNGTRRWTAGRARLPHALWEGCRGTIVLRVDLAGPALPRWVAPSLLPASTAAEGFRDLMHARGR